jgi:patatin-related protein
MSERHDPASQHASASVADFTDEVRLAVVLYGGVSLAIYINGMVQELYHLVRATAPAVDDDSRLHLADEELESTEHVYRELGRIGLDSSRPAADGTSFAASAAGPVRVRFVIDIVSGTSAGGINGVFLAKALANDQSLEGLRRLWISEGDLGKLLNDRRSVQDMPELVSQDPPRSLLNSERMYLQLKRALDGMKPRAKAKEPDDGARKLSPYVDELDLYVTTTDIRGFPVLLRLRDLVVPELRHRHVFHFVYGSQRATGSFRNDFEERNNPFLAFVARCTSAFPFAFEPMSVRDVAPLLGWRRERFEAELKRWERFFRGRLGPGGPAPRFESDAAIPIEERAYSDGGILDNKPFSYATDTLRYRASDLPVTRKLLYLEPVPQHLRPQPAEKPGPFETALRAASAVPAYEPIREDLERILDRNRWLSDLRELESRITPDVRAGVTKRLMEEGYTGTNYESAGLSALVAAHGVAYGTYHRLKVQRVIDDIAALVTRHAGFEEDSAQNEAIRYIVREWVLERYPEEPAASKRAQTAFLVYFDFGYRLRRLEFLRRKLRDLHIGRPEVLDLLSDLCRKNDLLPEWNDGRSALPTDYAKGLRDATRELSRDLRGFHVRLRQAGRVLRARRADETPASAEVAEEMHLVLEQRKRMLEVVADTRITSKELALLLESGSEAERRAYAQRLIWKRHESRAMPPGARSSAPTVERADSPRTIEPQLIQLEELLEAATRHIVYPVSDECRARLDPSAAAGASPYDRALRHFGSHFFRNFEAYDFPTYPLRAGTAFGESDSVDIVRFSPEDAIRLVDERGEHPTKLAGTKLANFGAFLEETWRQNDMMWGRLDAAERIIAMMRLPKAAEDDLRDRALSAILAEELPAEACRVLARELSRRVGGTPDLKRQLDNLLRQVCSGDTLDRARLVFRHVLDSSDAEFLDRFRDSPPRLPPPDPERSLTNFSRATRILGKMFEAAAEHQHANARPFAMLSWLGALAWRLVEISTPRSIPNLLLRYWLQLLTLAAVVIVVGGWLLHIQGLFRYGVLGIVVLGAFVTVPAFLGVLMEGWRRWGRIAWGVYFATVFAVLAYLASQLRLEVQYAVDVPGAAQAAAALVRTAAGFLGLDVAILVVMAYLMTPGTRSRPTLRSHWFAWALYAAAGASVVFLILQLMPTPAAATGALARILQNPWGAALVALFAVRVSWALLVPARQLVTALWDRLGGLLSPRHRA